MARLLATASALALCVAACAFPDIDFRPADEDDSSSTNSSSGAMGGMPGVGGSTGGVLTGGAGGEPPCVVGAPGQCPSGEKCTVDPSNGEIGCFTEGNRPAWTKCFSDTDCSSGTFCDGPTKVCHPVCEGVAQCAGPAAQCIPGRNEAGQALANVKICTSDCNPLNGTPCSDDGGKTTCFYDVNNALWDCAQTTGLGVGQACSGISSCDRGLVCINIDGSNECLSWCTPVNDFCGGLSWCTEPSNIEPTWSGTKIGICL